jgi:hypothetical protein
MKNILLRGLQALNRPLPGWLTLFLFAGALASATAVLPYFSSGTAYFGPGGMLDLGSVDATGLSANGSPYADPQVFDSGGTNLGLLAPNSSTISFINCLTSACSGGNQQTTATVSGTKFVSNVPVLYTPAGLSSPAPAGACYGHTGTVCGNSFHHVEDSVTVAVATSNCLTLTWCTLNGASAITLTGNAVFAGGSPFCYANGQQNNSIIAVLFGTSGSALTMNVFNATAGTLNTGTNELILYDCFGT